MSQPSFDLEFDEGLPTFTVGELADAINGALRRGFFEGRVRGEIQGLRERNGHLYFSLTDHEEGAKATIAVSLFANVRFKLRPLLQRHRLRLTDGMKVRIHGFPDFYGPTGRLTLKMSGIDPRYTLGELALEREDLVRRLVADGVYDAQARLRLPRLPLRVGLVTSVRSAAWHDVVDELARSGFGFRLAACDVRVQGPGAPRWWPPCGARSPGASSTSSCSPGAAAPGRSWRRSTPRSSPGRSRLSPARDHRARPRGGPQRGRRGGAPGAQDADGVRRPPRGAGRGLPGRRRRRLARHRGQRRCLGRCGRRVAAQPCPPDGRAHDPLARRGDGAGRRAAASSRPGGPAAGAAGGQRRPRPQPGPAGRRRPAPPRTRRGGTRRGPPAPDPSRHPGRDGPGRRLDAAAARVRALDPSLAMARGWSMHAVSGRVVTSHQPAGAGPADRDEAWPTARSAAEWRRRTRHDARGVLAELDGPGYTDVLAELEEILQELEADAVDVDHLGERVRRAPCSSGTAGAASTPPGSRSNRSWPSSTPTPDGRAATVTEPGPCVAGIRTVGTWCGVACGAGRRSPLRTGRARNVRVRRPASRTMVLATGGRRWSNVER